MENISLFFFNLLSFEVFTPFSFEKIYLMDIALKIMRLFTHADECGLLTALKVVCCEYFPMLMWMSEKENKKEKRWMHDLCI